MSEMFGFHFSQSGAKDLLKMFFKKRLGPTPKTWEIHKGPEEEIAPNDLERFERAFFQISSLIRAHRGLPRILPVVARESLKLLKACRSTIFLIDKESGTLQTQYTYARDPADKEVNQLQEKEIASQVLKQGRPLCLRGPEDFSDFIKYEDSQRKITSLSSIPLFSQGESVGTLSVVLIDEKRSFNEKDLRCLSIFGNQASLAIENTHLQEEVGKEIRLRKTIEQYLDHIFRRLESDHEKEYQPVEDHIGKGGPGQIVGGEYPPEHPPAAKIAGGNGDGTQIGESSPNGPEKDPTEGEMHADFEDASCGVADNLTRGDSSGPPAQ
jgi:hypothetical protein